MRAQFVELLVQLGLVIGYGVGAAVSGLIGLLIEYNGLLRALEGEVMLAAWMAVLGAVALGFSYFIISDKLLPTLRAAT